MLLAKPHLDIGMFPTDIAAERDFWANEVGLRLDHELHVQPGWDQYRYDAHDSVIKVNDFRDATSKAPRSGYVELTIAADRGSDWADTSPDGSFVRLVPTGTNGIVKIGITVASPNPDRMIKFYTEAMEFEQVDKFAARCGDTLIFVTDGAGGSEVADFKCIGGGYRYLTVQIFDADAACGGIVARGGRIARAPENYGTIARVGFVKDPDGNWIEISARASLTGVQVGA